MPTLPQQPLGVAARTLSGWANHFATGTPSLAVTAAGSLMVFPLSPAEGVLPGALTANTLLIGISCNSVVLTATGPVSFAASLGLYTLANSTQLSLLNSASMGFSAATSALGSIVQGARQVPFFSSQWSAVPVLGQSHYWIGLQYHSQGNAFPLMSHSGFRWMGSQFSGHVGVGNTNSSASRPFPGMGVYSVSFTTALPSAIAFSDLRQANALAGAIPSIVINNIGA